MPTRTNKLKNINDPVYGSVAIPTHLVFDVMEHPWFQRLRRIKQLGLTHYTFPSAQHTRFQHALGSMHLMGMAINVLRSKGVGITEAEAEGLTLAILLHDIGHGPFSHTLDQTLVRGIPHEEISRLIIASLNKQFNGSLDIAYQIFTGTYPKKFLHQLVSSQLDMDRLDYLARDSFFTGVAEGVISYERIIKMLTVYEDELVVEAKGVYSIEKFLISRRLMYWQVYLHKTVIAADQMLVNLLKRAQFLGENNISLPATPELSLFLENHPTPEQFETESRWIETFAQLDDTDVVAAIKMWRHHPDPVLSNLCSDVLDRRLFRVELQKMPFDPNYVNQIQAQILRCYPIHPYELFYYFIHDTVENKAYNPLHDRIMIKGRNNDLLDISEASEQLNIAVLPTTVSKHLLCYPKQITV